jgi:hypothetical protein
MKKHLTKVVQLLEKYFQNEKEKHSGISPGKGPFY